MLLSVHTLSKIPVNVSGQFYIGAIVLARSSQGAGFEGRMNACRGDPHQGFTGEKKKAIAPMASIPGSGGLYIVFQSGKTIKHASLC